MRANRTNAASFRLRISRAAALAVAVAALLQLPGTARAIDFQSRSAVNDPSGGTPGSYEATLPDAPFAQTLTLDAASRRGAAFQLWPQQEHTVEVSGIYAYDASAGQGRLADAECATDSGSPTWAPNRFTGADGRDILDVKVAQGAAVSSFDWVPVSPSSSSPGCAGDAAHTYRAILRPLGGEARFFADDSSVTDNAGTLTVTVSRGPLDVRRQTSGVGYQCGKHIIDQFRDTGEKVHGIDRASLTLDTRRNPSETPDPGREGGRWPFYKETGYDGSYLCNWPAPGVGYRILAAGSFKYDQTTPEPYTQADAECATGYPQRPGDKPDRLIPHYYRWGMGWAAENREGEPLDPYGTSWKPERYEYAYSGTEWDPFDLRVDRNPHLTWRPLYPDAAQPACSDGADRNGDGRPDRLYVLDPDPATAEIEPWFGLPQPLHFLPYDLMEYYEWDQCGLLQVTMERQETAVSVEALRAAARPDYPPAQQPCAWTPPTWAETIRLTDDPRADNPTLPFWYYPGEAVVKSGTKVVWVDQSAIPHSITAVEVAGARPFDSHPECDAALNRRKCMFYGDAFVWTAQATTEPIVIDYFCRVRPDMTGTIVVVP